MPYYPKLSGRSSSRTVTEYFRGYNHNLKIADGEFYETKNLTADHFPLLSNRAKRGRLSNTFTNLQAIIAKDKLYWVDNGTLYADGVATGLTGLQNQKETQLVSMGAYICIFPDNKYYNTQKPADYGDMGASWSYSGSVTYTMCHQDGTYYTDITASATEPEDPDNGAIWIDISDDDTVYEWSVYLETWVTLETVYTRMDFETMGQIPAAFRERDAVNISGAYIDDLNGSKILIAVGGDDVSYDYAVVIGICPEQYIQGGASITISRDVPAMDYVCEAQNRLWGCYYGNNGTENINEIYCCALGDFRNWEQYQGISTDSWRASRGSDGKFTGCINYLGTPTFFKENVIHTVTVSPIGAHQINDIPARGVQDGSHKSLAVVNETLYYKTRTGVVAYQGGMPADVGSALGDVLYGKAAAGVVGQKYYISMQDRDNDWHMFVYDVSKGLWMHEDGLHAEAFARCGDELYCIADGGLTALLGSAGVKEDDVEWGAVTGIMYYEQNTGNISSKTVRYAARYNIRLSMAMDAEMKMFIEYDSSGVWTYAGDFKLPNTGTVTIPVRPRRCDHLRLKLEGHGDVRIYSIARILERGSDT